MKKLAIIFAASLSVLSVTPAQASVTPTIAIIDTGFNASQFGSSVVQEVCVTSSATGCDTGTGFDSGTGASGTTYKVQPRFTSDWNHGSLMASSVLSVNPNAKLVLIRNSRVYSNGNVAFGSPADLKVALKWVQENASIYNIVGVSMSRGSHTYLINNKDVRTSIYNAQVYSKNLVKMNGEQKFSASIKKFTALLDGVKSKLASMPDIACPADNELKSLISNLKTINVATFFATGNDYNSRYVDDPACIDDAIAVTAFNNNKIIDIANTAPNTDFAGVADNTSVATAKVAGKWSLVYNGTYETTYNSIKNSGITLDRYSIVGVN